MTLCREIVGSAGLVLDVAGALLLTSAVILSDKEAEELASTRWDVSPSQKADRLHQSRKAWIGGALLVLGFIGQLVAVWI